VSIQKILDSMRSYLLYDIAHFTLIFLVHYLIYISFFKIFLQLMFIPKFSYLIENLLYLQLRKPTLAAVTALAGLRSLGSSSAFMKKWDWSSKAEPSPTIKGRVRYSEWSVLIRESFELEKPLHQEILRDEEKRWTNRTKKSIKSL